eukprot:TRINITY_DN7705_c0_g1_i1.p4 TRINITY_DN7705_c0_g1~~TRINITY_DN7705_c0_g1_i1.p4  ORF type:complete len:150 (+),score=50.48 TRINITY_DN7705_c0_g1_i1:104-553(+)
MSEAFRDPTMREEVCNERDGTGEPSDGEIAALAASLLQKFDEDGDGRLNKQEFINVATALRIIPSEETQGYAEAQGVPVYEAMYDVGAGMIGYDHQQGIGVAHAQAFIAMHPANLSHARAVAAGRPLPPPPRGDDDASPTSPASDGRPC